MTQEEEDAQLAMAMPKSHAKPVPTTPGSSIPKRKTKVSDLISRLSSSTASSRAKYEANKQQTKQVAAEQSSRSSLRSVFKPRNSGSGAPPGRTNRHSLASVTGASSIRHSHTGGLIHDSDRTARRHRRTASELSESSVFFPKITSSPPPPQPPQRMVSRPKPRIKSSPASGGPSRNVSATNSPAVSQGSTVVASSASTSPSTQYSNQWHPQYHHRTGLSNSDISARSMSDNSIRPQTMPPRPASRQQRVNVRRPTSRMGANSASSHRVQSPRVDELKSKIAELEEVLKHEKTERDAVFSRVEQIRELENQLTRERHEKESLASRIRILEQLVADNDNDDNNNNTDTTDNNSDNDPANENETRRFSGPMRAYYEARILELEGRIREVLAANAVVASNDSEAETKFTNQILELQTEITFMQGDNSALKKETEYYQSIMKTRDDEIRKLKNKKLTLDADVADFKSKLEVAQSEAVEWQGKHQVSEKQLEAKDQELTEKILQLETTATSLRSTNDRVCELEAKAKEDETQIKQLTEEGERLKTERNELLKQVHGFQTSRRHLDKQMAALERDNRRGKRLITALETSLQDLKISLEEKAMENDELNRSIMKVMEQANETIEGAKRSSMVISSPPLTRHSMSGITSPVPESANASPNIGNRSSTASSRSDRSVMSRLSEVSTTGTHSNRNSASSMTKPIET
ncbi:hypothetical protein TRVA0_010S02630 [Trichomonascus vanleenenianus]|uniref:uncharacterized protein n=1 Tax=Trichomonascus vanleenenianus TaxID=2268995 RepID=UPI003ECAC62E